MALADRRRDWFKFTRVFDRAARAFGATLPAGVLTALLLIVLPELALYWLGDEVASGLSFTDMLRSSFNVGSGGLGLITLVAGTLGHAGIVHVALLQFHREPVGAGQGLLSSFRFALPAIGIGILTWLGVVLGLILLIVPGLMLMTIWVVALPVELNERVGVIPAIEESGELTKGVRWQVFGLLILTGAFFIALSLIAEGIGNFAPEGLDFIDDGILSPLLAGFAALFTSYGTASLFYELKWGDRDPTEEITAEVFD